MTPEELELIPLEVVSAFWKFANAKDAETGVVLGEQLEDYGDWLEFYHGGWKDSKPSYT